MSDSLLSKTQVIETASGVTPHKTPLHPSTRGEYHTPSFTEHPSATPHLFELPFSHEGNLQQKFFTVINPHFKIMLMSKFKFNIAVIVSAGKSKRMKTKINKNLLLLDDKPIISHTIKKFDDSDEINFIVLVINKNDRLEVEKVISISNFDKPIKIIFGGKSRQDSAMKGLEECLKIVSTFKNVDEKILNKNVVILVHNACNPFTTTEEIKRVIQKTQKTGFCLVGRKINDTIKEVVNNKVVKTIERENKWLAQTPQGMNLEVAKKILKSLRSFRFIATDDSQLAEKLGYKPHIISCSPFNFKITTEEDVEKARFIALNQTTLQKKGRIKNEKNGDIKILVGIGKDSHRFGNTSKPLILAGVKIPYQKGFVAHSDGDVVYHAIFNAISSALGMRSIGYFFSDNDVENKHRNSAEFILKIFEILEAKNLRINNVTVVIEGKEPPLEQYVEEMRKNISKILNTRLERVGITITSGEELTAWGKGKGLECTAYVSIKEFVY